MSGPATAETVIEGSAIRCKWEVVQGALRGVVENRKTGERLRCSGSGLRASVRYAAGTSGGNLPLRQAGWDGAFSATFEARDSSAAVRMHMGAEQEGLVIRCSANSTKPGVQGVYWSLTFDPRVQGNTGGNPTPWRLLIPAVSGMAFSAPPPFHEQSFSWPISWEAAMVVIQGPRGGFVVRADDPDLRYKALRIRWETGRWTLEFGTENTAPFDAKKTAESVVWRIDAYAGDWRKGADIYRRWMETALSLTRFERKRPSWAQRIRFVVITGMDAALLDELARRVPPENTLLYVPTWRKDSYDKNYPEYDAAPGFGDFVARAHRLGFRVMVHVNYFGCDAKHPLYRQFERYQLRDPRTGKKMWWVPPLERDLQKPRIKFAYIHPGCTAWRQLLIDRFVRIVRTYKVDALHLDQTLVMPNNAGGLVEGRTVIQGNLLLHQELRQALPDTALSGEGLDEVTVRFEHFAQRHVFYRALDRIHHTWDNRYLEASHPISSYLLLPWCRMYGYLGMASPSNVQMFRAWRRAYAAWGILPTLARPTRAMLTKPGPDLEALLGEAAFDAASDAEPDIRSDAPWPENLRFRFAGPSGARLEYRNPERGILDCVAVRKAGERRLLRYIYGRTTYAGAGEIPGWPVYNQKAALALDPDLTWLVLDRPRDPRKPHLTAVPQGCSVQRLRMTPGDRMAVEFRGRPFLDLVEAWSGAETGTRLDGIDRPLERGASFEPVTATCGGEQRSAIFAHPPWQPVPGEHGALGVTFGRYRIRLPAAPPMLFQFGLGLRGRAAEKSDGVTFEVRIDGRTIFRKHHAGAGWEDHQVSLAEWAGRDVVLELVTGPGPKGNASYDWALWGRPALIPGSRKDESVVLEGDRAPEFVVSTARPDVFRPQVGKGETPGTTRVVGPVDVPGGITFLWCSPRAVTGPVVDLSRLPVAVSAVAYDRPLHLPARYVGFGPGTAASGGEQRSGIAAHPPDHGRVYGEYFLRLPPAQRVTLTFAVGLREGARSSGVRFMVAANGRTVFDRLVTAPDGWHPGEIDLSRFSGKPVLLGFIVDSYGSHYYDWAFWADPRLRIRGR